MPVLMIFFCRSELEPRHSSPAPAGGGRGVPFPTLLFIPMSDKPSMSPGAPSKEQLKEMIEEKLLGQKNELKNQVSKFESMNG